MNTLADLLNFVVTTLQTFPLCRSVRVIESHPFSERQFAFKVRAELASGGMLQVYLYRNDENIDYAYQVSRGEKTVLRWDNKEHFPDLATYPHHFHIPSGTIEVSPLTGDPFHDIPFVLNYLVTSSI